MYAGEDCLGASRGDFAASEVRVSWLAVLDRVRWGDLVFVVDGWRTGPKHGTPAYEHGAGVWLGLVQQIRRPTHLYNDRLPRFIWRGLFDPFANCPFLIRLNNGDVAHFNKEAERQGSLSPLGLRTIST